MRSTFILIAFFLFFCSKTSSLSAQECDIIYVAPNGVSSGVAGTRANPASLSYALMLVSPSSNLLWLATGTYPLSNIFMIPSNITIEGGFDQNTWIKSNAANTIIDRDTSASVITSNFYYALVGLVGNASTNFRLQDLTINIANAPRNQISAYGVYLTDCSNYNITRCNVNSGAGSDGTNGAIGAIGSTGAGGAAGINGALDSGSPNGGLGGNGGNNGGNGGSCSNSGGVSGLSGAGSCGGGGGVGGASTSMGWLGTNGDCSSTTGGTPGQTGGNGIAGANGILGAAGITLGGYFAPGAAGGNGVNGTNGCGGGGGGSGGENELSGPNSFGGGGGGGGGGGFAGVGGGGGTGGGGSFGVFANNNGVSGIVEDCFLNPGLGGAGGIGGFGGAGGGGGNGGIGGAAFDCSNNNGGNGGAGGAGGAGGIGGNGSTGMSMGLFETGGIPVTNSGIGGIPGVPFIINVLYKGCINSEVLFSAPTSGTWNFGAGASPATAIGTGPFSVYYSSMGRKDIVFDGTTFTGYVTIFQAAPATPSISPANSTVTLGCPNTFTTSLTGTYYQWIFGNTATPDTLEGVTMQTASNIYFGAPGTYTIYVYVTTDCCGKVKDSTIVTVNSSTYNVALTPLPAVSCEGSPITFTASPSTYIGYDFYVNGNSVQNGPGNTFTSSSLLPGDSVVVVALANTCFTNPSAVLFPTIIPFPVVTLSSSDPDSTICEGTSVLFIATPVGYTNYEFFDGATSVQSGTSLSYITTTLLPGNSITVVATNGGCTGLPSNAEVTTVNLAPQIVLTSSDADNVLCGTGQSVTFTASPAGFTNYDFFNAGITAQTGASNTFTTTTLTNGSSIEVIATSSSGCVGQTSNTIVVFVNPIPNAWLGSSDPDNTICQNELITFTSIPAGYDNYEFFDGGISVQNGVSNLFTTTLNPGNSITVVATDLGCSSTVSNAITITIIPADNVNAGNDFAVCLNSSIITLTGFSPANGTWTGSGITNPSGIFDPAIAGVGAHKLIYSFSNSNDCIGYDTLFAIINPLPIVSTSPVSPTICEGLSVNLTASGANTYSWSPPSGLSSTSGSNVSASPGATTTYTIIGTSNNCTDSATTTVIVYPIPTVSISGQTTIGVCENTVLSAFPSSSGTYYWGPAVNMICNTCQSVTVAPMATQKYYVTYTSTDGCVDSDTITVDVISIFNYFMPSGFSPNGDGVNDTLNVHGRGIESVSLKIFDRIGENVFETTSLEHGWDGKFHDIPMNDGTFVYLLEVKFCNGETKKEQGSLTLVR